MRNFKKATIRSVTGVCALLLGLAGLAPSAVAITMNQASPQFLGIIDPDIPASEAAEATYINFLIGLDPTTSGTYSGQEITRSANILCFPTCPGATATGSVKDESESNSGNFGYGFTYLLGKYDATRAGALVWYVAGLTGEFEIPQLFGNCGSLGNPAGCGLSHWALYNPGTSVPEPSTPLLLGLGLAFAFFGRKLLPKG